jgi:hypothetical protein
MATAKVGHGLTFTRSGWPASLNVIDVDISGIEREMYEASHMGTTSYHEYIPAGLIDPGTITVTCEYTGTFPTFDSTATATTLTHNGGTARTVSTLVQSVSPGIPLAGKMTAQVTLKATGAWT